MGGEQRNPNSNNKAKKLEFKEYEEKEQQPQNDDVQTSPNPNFENSLTIINNVGNFLAVPVTCVGQSLVAVSSGVAMGSLVGFGSGVFKKEGFKGSIASAGATAKAFGILSGVHALVQCIMRLITKKDQALNGVVAGCCSGIAMSWPGPPQTLVQSCVTFGAFSYMNDYLSRRSTALAHSGSLQERNHPSVLPPLAFPLPKELQAAFSAFCESLKKPRKHNPPFTT